MSLISADTQVAGPFLASIGGASGGSLFAAFTDLADASTTTTTTDAFLIVPPAEALADTALLFIKAVWCHAERLRSRVHTARVRLLRDLLAALKLSQR